MRNYKYDPEEGDENGEIPPTPDPDDTPPPA